MSIRVALLGPPGSGKGTLGKDCCLELGLERVCAGDLLRGAAQRGHELIERQLSQGLMVSDDCTFQLIETALQQVPRKGWLLDGFPRSLSQLELLLNSEWCPTLFLYLRVPRAVLVQRLLGRRMHTPSGRIYHVIFNPPQHEGLDDVTGEPLTIRSDDCEQVIQRRLDLDEAITQPLVERLKRLWESRRAPFEWSILDANRSMREVKASALDRISTCLAA